MGSLVWVLNLWSLRLAEGAAALAIMGATIALYGQAQAARNRLDAAYALVQEDAASRWEGM